MTEQTNRYNVPMIRDFLEHLTCELRIDLFELTAERDKLNPEVLEELRKNARRYNVALRVSTDLDMNGVAEVDREPQLEKYRQQERQRVEAWLAHLDGLRDLFAEALTCAAEPGVEHQRFIRLGGPEGGDESGSQ